MVTIAWLVVLAAAVVTVAWPTYITKTATSTPEEMHALPALAAGAVLTFLAFVVASGLTIWSWVG